MKKSAAEIKLDEYLIMNCHRHGYENRPASPAEEKYLTQQFHSLSPYEKRVMNFNFYSGKSYSADVHFLTFRSTSKGILVGFTAGKPNEISELRMDVAKANSESGINYYCKF